MATPSQHDEIEYYDGFVVLDSCRAVVATFETFDEARAWAYEVARQYQTYRRVITLEVYGCTSEGYSTDEEDSTLVYSTDDEL